VCCVANQEKASFMPCGNRSPGDQFPKLYVLGFAVSCVSTGVCCDHGLIYLTMVCSSGAKCFFAYSAGILGSTIARKSTLRVSNQSSVIEESGWCIPSPMCEVSNSLERYKKFCSLLLDHKLVSRVFRMCERKRSRTLDRDTTPILRRLRPL
jgi:hypothetical protein